MEVFIFIVAIVAISCVAGVMNNYIKLQQKRTEKGGMDADVEAELDELRGRIEVLEQIVTDEKYQLHRKISEL
jgi:hypothetical protein